MPVATETGQQEQMQQLLAGLTAVRGGDFSIRLPEGQDALMNDIAAVFNAMNEQLGVFTSEVTRVAREVGTEGQLGGQAEVPAVAGTVEGPHRLGQARWRATSPGRSEPSPR